MAKVLLGLSMSLDGFIAGPNDCPTNPLGDGGARLFDWRTTGTERLGPDDRFKPPARSREVVKELFNSRAIITGRRTFDIANGWGGHHPTGAPFFLLTHNPPKQWVGSCEVEAKPLPITNMKVGIDLGLKHLAIPSEGEPIESIGEIA